MTSNENNLLTLRILLLVIIFNQLAFFVLSQTVHSLYERIKFYIYLTGLDFGIYLCILPLFPLLSELF